MVRCRAHDHLYDGILATDRKSNYPERAAAMQLWSDYFSRLQSADPVSKTFSSTWPATLLVPALEKAEQNWEKARAQRRLSRRRWRSVAAFKAEHNEYLAAARSRLLPKYLSENPAR